MYVFKKQSPTQDELYKYCEKYMINALINNIISTILYFLFFIFLFVFKGHEYSMFTKCIVSLFLLIGAIYFIIGEIPDNIKDIKAIKNKDISFTSVTGEFNIRKRGGRRGGTACYIDNLRRYSRCISKFKLNKYSYKKVEAHFYINAIGNEELFLINVLE